MSEKPEIKVWHSNAPTRDWTRIVLVALATAAASFVFVIMNWWGLDAAWDFAGWPFFVAVPYIIDEDALLLGTEVGYRNLTINTILALVGIYAAAVSTSKLIEAVRARSFRPFLFRFHLSTALLLVISASVLLAINLFPRPELFGEARGWPMNAYFTFKRGGVIGKSSFLFRCATVDLVINLTLLYSCYQLGEWFVRMRQKWVR